MPGNDRIKSQYDDINYSLSRERGICESCVADPALSAIVRNNPFERTCEFCRGTNRAGKLSAVLEAIRECLAEEWSETSEEFDRHLLGPRAEDFGPSSEDDDLEQTALTLSEVFEEVNYRPSNPRYLEAVRRAFRGTTLYFRGEEAEEHAIQHRESWERFCEIVKHERRFTFWSVGPSASDPHELFETSAGKMLDSIGGLIRKHSLFKTYPANTSIWRARLHDADVRLRNGHGLFPPPQSKAVTANRMSPPGVVMFYGAEEPSTTLVEIVDSGADWARSVTYAEFATTKELTVLDLFNLDKIPSYFGRARETNWNDASFIRRFAWEISSPIPRGHANHVEYVPTQAFTEFVRYQLKGPAQKPIEGIRYRSSKDNKPCIVLFCTGRECEIAGADHDSSHRTWLALAPRSITTVRVQHAFRKGDPILPRRNG